MDEIFSTTDATASSCDLVNENALAWIHIPGTNSVSTPDDQVLAGWRLSKAEYGDIKLTINTNGA